MYNNRAIYYFTRLDLSIFQHFRQDQLVYKNMISYWQVMLILTAPSSESVQN